MVMVLETVGLPSTDVNFFIFQLFLLYPEERIFSQFTNKIVLQLKYKAIQSLPTKIRVAMRSLVYFAEQVD
jgi:hypothetical protein